MSAEGAAESTEYDTLLQDALMVQQHQQMCKFSCDYLVKSRT